MSSVIGIDAWDAIKVEISTIQVVLNASMSYDVERASGPADRYTGSASYSLTATFPRESFSHLNPITEGKWQVVTGRMPAWDGAPKCFRGVSPEVLSDVLQAVDGSFNVNTETFYEGVLVESHTIPLARDLSLYLEWPAFTLIGGLRHGQFENWQSGWPLFGSVAHLVLEITDPIRLNGGSLSVTLDPLPEPDSGDWTVHSWNRSVDWAVTVF